MTRAFCSGLLVAIVLAVAVHAQGDQAPAKGHGAMGMMADCQKSMAGMKADQKKLDDLLAKMNAATGQLKVDQMAALLAELVAQHKTMNADMKCMGHEPAATSDEPKQPPQTGHEQHH